MASVGTTNAADGVEADRSSDLPHGPSDALNPREGPQPPHQLGRQQRYVHTIAVQLYVCAYIH